MDATPIGGYCASFMMHPAVLKTKLTHTKQPRIRVLVV